MRFAGTGLFTRHPIVMPCCNADEVRLGSREVWDETAPECYYPTQCGGKPLMAAGVHQIEVQASRALRKTDSYADEIDPNKVELVYSLAIQTANDIVPFDFHRIYHAHSESRRFWTYHLSFFGDDDSQHIMRSDGYYSRLLKSKKPHSLGGAVDRQIIQFRETIDKSV